ncbi:single-stranded DNA-binding protein [Dactylosporangium sp. NPDC049140]|uniref:single-stranded DNA-binding protein n=1 Tax=Dactylosporangium sp. NPDC049140 TaxID=3155647 RepID=UPI0033CF5714
MSGETTVTVVGNLTADPELRFTGSGVGLCKFTVASTPRMFDKNRDEYRDGEPLFMPCTAWRDLAEHVAESLTRGARVVVTGRLRLSRWETEAGEKRSMMQLEVDEIGPSLRFATAKVQKLTRSGGDGFLPNDVPDEAWNAAAPAGSGSPLRAA